MRLYQHLLVSLKGKNKNNMMTVIKERSIVCCFIITLFLLSGCTGLNTSAPAEKSVQKSRNIKTQNAPGTVEVTDKKVSDTKPQPKPSVVKPPVVKPYKETTMIRNAPGSNLENKRFNKAKKEMNSFSGEAVSNNKKKSAAGGISFNFDNADLYEVIRTMADILNINFIVGPNVRGKVTIHSAGELDKSDLFPLFFQILELNGLTALKEGKLYRIIAKDKISATPILTRYGRDLNEIPNSERMVMQIIPLEYILPKVIIPTLTPFLSDSGTIIPKEGSDVIIIIDKTNNLKRILQLVDVFDVDLFDNINHRFFKLHNIEAEEALKLINGLIGPYLKIDQSESKIIAIERINTIVAISNNERVLDKVEMFIKKIDVQDNSADSRIFIYRVKNSDAEDLASLLNQVFKKEGIVYSEQARKSKDSQINKKTGNNVAIKLFPKPDKKKNIKKTIKSKSVQKAGMGGSASLSKEITIIPDPVRNALIIDAVPSDYIMVKQILRELDVLPRQVLIDVLILDVNITDSRTIGVDWHFLKDRVGGTVGITKADITSKGLTFAAGVTDDWVSAVKALATDDRAEVLSSPSILASDNKPATINVVTQIPIASSTYDADDGVTTTTIQYRDTGIILTVTPHINDDGMVSMEISQEVSSKVESSADESAPSFFNRNVSTTLSVKDRQTIVIGGLISETKTDNSKGVPWLSNLPLIGFLFGETTDSVIKSELIIMITPKVITTLSDIDSVSKEFTEKFYGLKNHKRIVDFLSN